MPRQSLMWTVLPGGRTPEGDGLRLSVLLSPRLDPLADPPRLSSFFPDWEDWPATLARATFRFDYGGTVATIPATQTAGPDRVDTALGPADSAVWRAIFPGDLFVRGFQFEDLADRTVLSYDTNAVAGLVRDLYGKLGAAAGDDLPLVSDFVDNPDWQSLVDVVGQIDGRFSDEATGLRDVDRQFDLYRKNKLAFGDPKFETLARLQLFHTPPGRDRPVTRDRRDDPRIKATWREQVRRPMPKPDQLAKAFDFHQIVAAMNPYPTILRRLGLVVDFVLAAKPFAPTADAPLSVTVTFAPGALKVPRTRDVSPVTHASLSKAGLRAVPNPKPSADAFRVRDGLLDLDPARFAVLQADVDAAGLKLMNFARSLGRVDSDDDRVDSVTRIEKQAGAPSLRTAGLMLVHHRRGEMLEQRLDASKDKNNLAEAAFQAPPNTNPAPPELWAEDLVRGFRVDVWDDRSGLWRSLYRRQASYELDGGALVVSPPGGEEEGTLRMATTTSADPKGHADLLYLHEAVVSWTGWSLAAPPPGRAILPDDSFDKTQAQTDAEIPPGIDFRSRFKATPGSLPRLRFGRRYWLRARVVDLAGNSLAPQEGDFGPERPKEKATPFLRWEPIAGPVIALVRGPDGTTESPAEGESMLRMAIRSFNDTSADNAIPTAQVARRFAVPQQVTAREAEYHGKLDAGGKVDASTFAMLALQKDKDAKDPAAALVEEKLLTGGPLDPSPTETVYAVYRDGEPLTYLPDPLAERAGARVLGHPGISPDEIIDIPLYPDGAWPEAQPFKVAVFEGTDAPDFDPTTRTLRIPLVKGQRATVRLAMQLSKDAILGVMGLWRWLSKSDQQAQFDRIVLGKHWMFTPWRTVEVVHAVQRPLIAPEFLQLVIERGRNQTYAWPRFLATCSIRTTDRVDLRAEWHEPSDNPSAPGAEAAGVDLDRGDVAFAVKITDPSSYATRDGGAARGGYPDHTIPAADTIGLGLPSRDLVSPKRHEFHDTRYRRIEYWLEATTKFREYLPADLLTEPVDGAPTPTEEHIKVVGPRRVSWIPSSAPPPAPAVLYVVPTFGWVRSTDAQGNASSWRRGGGLRVYLDRPWNASGYGEMLAVVLPPATFNGDPDAEPAGVPYRKYVTQWGNDPIWQSPFVAGLAPKRANFPLARTAPDPAGAWVPQGAPATEADQTPGPFLVAGLTPPGAATVSGVGSVEIAPHDVFYDEDRRLWYCDIEIDQGASYWPFVRLALARYQPTSVFGAHLSEVVLADFLPLTADRWLTVNRSEARHRRHVAVYGHSYSDSSARQEAAASPSMSLIDPLTHKVQELTPATPAKSGVIEVWVEKLVPSRGEDFGWVRLPDPVARTPVRVAEAEKAPAAQRFVPGDQIARAIEFQQARRFQDLVAARLVDKLWAFLPLWEGDVAIPAEPSPGNRLRLVIAEYEEYLVDDDRPYDRVPTRKDRRLVFVEHVELT